MADIRKLFIGFLLTSLTFLAACSDGTLTQTSASDAQNSTPVQIETRSIPTATEDVSTISTVTMEPTATSINSVTHSKDSSSILDVGIKDISFFSEKGIKLNPDVGWIHVQNNTKIVVNFSGSADTIDFIFTPTGTETYSLQRIIGTCDVGAGDTSGQLIWSPKPDQTLGYITVSINQGRYSYKSDLINVIFP